MAASLNDGKCKIPKLHAPQKLSNKNDQSVDSTMNIPLSGDFRRTYDDGDSFYIAIDPTCDLTTYTVTTDLRTITFDPKANIPFLR